MTVRIPRATFDAVAGYIRGLHTFLISQEMEWYSDDKRRVLGVLAKDIIDEGFTLQAGAVSRRLLVTFTKENDIGHSRLNLGLNDLRSNLDPDFFGRVENPFSRRTESSEGPRHFGRVPGFRLHLGCRNRSNGGILFWGFRLLQQRCAEHGEFPCKRRDVVGETVCDVHGVVG